MGDVLLGAGDISGAEEAYQRAIDLERPVWSAVAMTDLAELRAQQGAIEEATRLLQSVINGGDPNVAPMAADKLGTLLLIQADDVEGAHAAYQRAIDSGHPDWSVVARFNLTQLLDITEDTAGAEAQLRAIIGGPNRAYAAKAWDLLLGTCSPKPVTSPRRGAHTSRPSTARWTTGPRRPSSTWPG